MSSYKLTDFPIEEIKELLYECLKYDLNKQTFILNYHIFIYPYYCSTILKEVFNQKETVDLTDNELIGFFPELNNIEIVDATFSIYVIKISELYFKIKVELESYETETRITSIKQVFPKTITTTIYE